MKISLLLCTIVLVLSALNISVSQTLLKDDFLYNPQDSLEGVGGWYRSGINTPYNIRIVSPGLTYTGYAGSGRGNAVTFRNSAEGDIVLNNLTQVSTGSVYLAFMVRVDSLGANATQGYVTGLNQSVGTNLSSSLQIRKVTANTFNFGIRKRVRSTYTAATYNTGTTYLAVIRYIFAGGSNTDDTAKLYIFNSGVPATEPSSPTVFNADTLDMPNVGSVYITNNYAQGTLNGCKFTLDGFRIGTSWSNSVLSSVSQISSEIPASFSLQQNYPNPFNPSTKIDFALPIGGNVSLIVYDISGKEVEKIVDRELEAGIYSASFNGANLSSGAYYYRLSLGGKVNYTETKRMMLVK
jgi:hypothetical protein